MEKGEAQESEGGEGAAWWMAIVGCGGGGCWRVLGDGREIEKDVGEWERRFQLPANGNVF